ncbi:MAG: hypothetical protein ROR55_18205 [Devosia sp.]
MKRFVIATAALATILTGPAFAQSNDGGRDGGRDAGGNDRYGLYTRVDNCRGTDCYGRYRREKDRCDTHRVRNGSDAIFIQRKCQEID